MRSEYHGADGTRYQLAERLGSGAEGAVFAVRGREDLAVKIYDDGMAKEALEERRDKISLMLRMPVRARVEGRLIYAWPSGSVYEEGSFRGFLMPRVKGKATMLTLCRSDEARKRAYPGYSWRYGVIAAYNAAWAVDHLHKNGVVVGDLAALNILTDPRLQVTLIDCDSFDLRDPATGRHYPCTVAHPEMLAPELRLLPTLEYGGFTKESDRFMLACLIFRLLMGGADPFAARPTGKLSELPEGTGTGTGWAVASGRCVFVKRIKGWGKPSYAPPLTILPKELQELFRRVFRYSADTLQTAAAERPTAEEWARALYPAAAGLIPFTVCERGHMYPAHVKTCPWCRIEI